MVCSGRGPRRILRRTRWRHLTVGVVSDERLLGWGPMYVVVLMLQCYPRPVPCFARLLLFLAVGWSSMQRVSRNLHWLK